MEEVQVLIDTAQQYSQQDNYNDAVKYFLKAAKVFEQEQDYFDLAGMYEEIAGEYRKIAKRALNGEKDKALKERTNYLNKAVEAASKGVDGPRKIDCYFLLNKLFEDLKDKENLIKCYKEVSQIYLDQGDDLAAARSIYNMGAVYAAMGNEEKASQTFEVELKIIKDKMDDKQLAFEYAQMGTAFIDAKLFKSSMVYFKKALEIYINLNMLDGIAKMQFEIGNAYCLLDNPERARLHFDMIKGVIDNNKEELMANKDYITLIESYNVLIEGYRAIGASLEIKKYVEAKDQLINHIKSLRK